MATISWLSFATVNMNIAQIDSDNGEIVILNDGSNGQAAVICTVGEAAPFISILDGIWAILGGNYSIRTDCILEPQSPVLKSNHCIVWRTRWL